MKYLYIVLCALLLSSAVAVPVTSAQQLCSPTTPAGEGQFVIINTSDANAHIFWIDYSCVETAYGVIPPGEAVIQPSILGHHWVIRNDAGNEIVQLTAVEGNDIVFLDGTVFNPEPIPNSCSSNKTTDMLNLVVNNYAPSEKVLLSWIDDTNC